MDVVGTGSLPQDTYAGEEPVVIIGAGMAGLTAAYHLSRNTEQTVLVLEKDCCVGGASRTARFKGFRFDLGGHRFYTKKPEVDSFVEKIVGEDLLTVGRISRIHFNGRFVNYPLEPANALLSLGVLGSSQALADYVRVKLARVLTGPVSEDNFEQWAVDRFGRYLYEVYFKVYTEKIWGLPCQEISADFAHQRIKNLSFREAVKEALLGKSKSASLIREFSYPRYGFGQIVENIAASLGENGRVLVNHEVEELRHDDGHIRALAVRSKEGRRSVIRCANVISSIPVSDTIEALRPPAPDCVRKAAANLSYRDMVILLLVLNRPRVSSDHWIYVPSREIGFARLHEPKNWSAEMAPPDSTSLVLEYFCQRGDSRWQQPAEEMAAEAARDLEKLGLVKHEEITNFTTIRLPRAYPIYRIDYKRDLDEALTCLTRFRNLQSIGRNGRFVYTSSDHYIDMGLRAAENLLGANHDLGDIGRGPQYAESHEHQEA